MVDDAARLPRSGTPIDLRAGDAVAAIASIGASLRRLTVAGRDLVVPFDADVVRPAYRGATLVPWPNRVIDGRYRFAGTEHRLAHTEPSRGHALHGLGVWRDWTIVDCAEDRVELGLEIEPREGYPWRVSVRTTYVLGPDGIEQAVHATNLDDEPAPWGTGPHPYVVAGPGMLETWTLELPARRVQLVTDDRLVPTGVEDVEVDAARFDFRTPRLLGDVALDHAFTGLDRDAGGDATVTVRDPSGTGVAVRFGTACPWVQVHTADLPSRDRAIGHRAGLAVEPMTCAPGAFEPSLVGDDAGLVVLQPGGTHTASWAIATA